PLAAPHRREPPAAQPDANLVRGEPPPTPLPPSLDGGEHRSRGALGTTLNHRAAPAPHQRYRAPARVLNNAWALVPSKVTAARQTAAMRASIRPYSIIVAPSVRLNSFFAAANIFRMTPTFLKSDRSMPTPPTFGSDRIHRGLKATRDRVEKGLGVNAEQGHGGQADSSYQPQHQAVLDHRGRLVSREQLPQQLLEHLPSLPHHLLVPHRLLR